MSERPARSSDAQPPDARNTDAQNTDVRSPGAAPPITDRDRDPALRHDVRNLLAPAMIALDRLSAHADQAVRAEAERGIAAIEAAVSRLKQRR